MPIQVATMCAAHDALWVGTENGVTLAFPFSAPAAIAEESGWELIKVGGLVFRCEIYSHVCVVSPTYILEQSCMGCGVLWRMYLSHAHAL